MYKFPKATIAEVMQHNLDISYPYANGPAGFYTADGFVSTDDVNRKFDGFPGNKVVDIVEDEEDVADGQNYIIVRRQRITGKKVYAKRVAVISKEEYELSQKVGGVIDKDVFAQAVRDYIADNLRVEVGFRYSFPNRELEIKLKLDGDEISSDTLSLGYLESELENER